MALVFLPGASVAVTVGSATYQFFAVSINAGQALINVSTFGDVYETFIGGLQRCSGQVSCYVQGGSGTGNENPFQVLNPVTMTITYATDDVFSFSAILGERVISTDVNGAVIATFQFVKTGQAQPTNTWS